MNELNISLSKIKQAKCLGPENCEPQLYQLSPITFAIYEQQSETIIIAFASPILAECLDRLGAPKINRATCVKITQLVEAAPPPERAIRLLLADNRTIALSSDDSIAIETTFRSQYSRDIRLLSPHRIWGQSSFQPLDCMLLTPRIAQVLNEISSQNNQLELAATLWRDYQFAIHCSANKTHEIDGDFMTFTARCFSGYLIVFDLKH